MGGALLQCYKGGFGVGGLGCWGCEACGLGFGVWGLGFAPEDALQQLESQRQFARVNAVCQ